MKIKKLLIYSDIGDSDWISMFLTLFFTLVELTVANRQKLQKPKLSLTDQTNDFTIPEGFTIA